MADSKNHLLKRLSRLSLLKRHTLKIFKIFYNIVRKGGISKLKLQFGTQFNSCNAPCSLTFMVSLPNNPKNRCGRISWPIFLTGLEDGEFISPQGFTE